MCVSFVTNLRWAVQNKLNNGRRQKAVKTFLLSSRAALREQSERVTSWGGFVVETGTIRGTHRQALNREEGGRIETKYKCQTHKATYEYYSETQNFRSQRTSLRTQK